MKNWIFGFAMLAGMNSASALELEIAPLALRAKAEVMGIQAGVDAGGIVVMTGEAAQFVADLAGVAIDTSAEMIILTGREIDELLMNPVKYAVNTGHAVIVTGEALTQAALNLTEAALKDGVKLVRFAGHGLSETAQDTITLLARLSKGTVALASDTGRFVVRQGEMVLGKTARFLCGTLRFVGLDLGC